MDKISLLLFKKNIRVPLEFLLCLGVCFFGMWYVLRLDLFNIHIPYVYRGDGLSTGLFIKGMIENGWYNLNPSVGAPFGLEMYDYPLGADNLQYFIMKVLSLFNANYVWVMNMYYLLTFPFCMLSAYGVFRHFKVNVPLSISVSLLYTFIPYHIIRTGHLFLLGYYMIPLVVMVIIWLAHKEKFLLSATEENRTKFLKYKINWNRELIIAFVICGMIGSTGAYYAFFACFFLLIIGFMQFVLEKKYIKLVKSLLLIVIIGSSLIVNISPSLLYKLNNSQGESISSRNFEAAEVYGLKIVQLLLPTTNHNIDWVAEKKDEYNSKAPLVNENDTATLGIFGSIGFLFLLFILFFRKNDTNEIARYSRTLSVMNISAILLGTIGGFGVLFAALVSAQIRSYNRLSIFIAFFSLLALAINLNVVTDKLKPKFKYIAILVVALFISLVGMYDQTTHPLAPSKITAETYDNDAEFVNQVSELMPSQSMIFQIPYVSFPEGEHLNNMGNYDLLKGYIHSKDLHWSFGNMKNSFGDQWMKELIKRPLKEALDIISYSGFSGVYIDRSGYSTEYAGRLESELLGITKVKPIESANKMLAFYDLREHVNQLQINISKEEWEMRKQNYLSKVNYGSEIVVKGDEKWEFVQSKEGYKIVQSSSFVGLPDDQLDIKVVNENGADLSFNDEFEGPNHYSNRHWEQPSHLVISLSNSASGWGGEYVPSSNEIDDFFNKHRYSVYYTQKHDQLSFKEVAENE